MSVVLMYHSVGTVPAGTDIFDLHVAPERFGDQIAALASAYEILPLGELYNLTRTGHAPHKAVALTFDDGYANNLTAAAPILQKHKAPATLFLCTGFLGRNAYWWDHLTQIVLTATRYPRRLAHLEPSFAGAEPLLREAAASQEAPESSTRKELVLALWGALRHLSLDRIYALLGELDSLFAPGIDLSSVRPLRADEVPLAAEAFTIGAHTVTHPFLTSVDDERLSAEIADSWRLCRTLSGQAVACFSYPFGDVDQRVAGKVAPGMALACTVREGAVGPDTDPLLIPRVQVPNWGPEQLKAKLEALVG